jgi:hypothetical protein
MFLHVRGACGARTVARERHLVLSILWCENPGREGGPGREVRGLFDVYKVSRHDIDTSRASAIRSSLVRLQLDSCRAVVCGEIGNVERHYHHLICSLSDGDLHRCNWPDAFPHNVRCWLQLRPPTAGSNAWSVSVQSTHARDALHVCQRRLKPLPRSHGWRVVVHFLRAPRGQEGGTARAQTAPPPREPAATA